MKLQLLAAVITYVLGVRPSSSFLMQLEPTDLKLASMAEIASQENIKSLSQTSVQAKSDTYGWSSLLQPSSMSMLICGSIMMMFVIPMTWLNERKTARIHYVLSRGISEVVPYQSPTHIKWQQNFNLVHCVGRTNTDKAVKDDRFNISLDQTIRLIRRVEMLQWVEIKREEQSSEGNKTWYEYRQEWSTGLIDHKLFDQQRGHENPRVMACQGETFNSEKAYLGQYSLNISQIARLSKFKDFRPNDDQKDDIIQSTTSWLTESGFDTLTYKTQYFETKLLNSQQLNLAPEIGTMRISWVYVPCSKTTVMAQQMQIENDIGLSEFTFRKWNPDKERVMWGSDNGSSFDPVCPVVCCCGFFTEVLFFRLIFNETIDHCAYGEKTPQEILQEYRKSPGISGLTNMYRVLTWLLSIAGNFLIFSPMTFGIVWIPFVGTLLQSTFFFTGLIFAIVLATALHLMIISIAWIWYRPLMGALLFGFSATIVGLMALGQPLDEYGGRKIYQSNNWI